MSNTTIERRVLARSHGSAAVWRAALARAIKQLIAWIRNEREIRRGIERLRSLDDRALADIGLGRGEIELAARSGRFSTAVNQQPWPTV
jgi:uncharacterized protein YjiS (DUF1127 family)